MTMCGPMKSTIMSWRIYWTMRANPLKHYFN